MLLKRFIWKNTQNLKLLKSSDSLKTSSLKVWASTASILVGVLISFIILLGSGANPFSFYEGVVKYSLGGVFRNLTLTTFAIYILGGLAIAVAFKARFFNIGVSGQMLCAGSLVAIFGTAETNYVNGTTPLSNKMDPALFMIIAFFIAVLAGMVVAGIAGFCKAYFRINEVVTAIMLNYAVFFIMRWAFLNHPAFYDPNAFGSKNIAPNYNFMIDGMQFIVPLIIAVVLAVGMFVLLRYTTLGFRIKAIGVSRTVPKYAGISIKNNLMYSALISGALAGMVGYFYYLSITSQITFRTTLLPEFGFNCIAVALVAFNNPLGIILVAFLWGVLDQGTVIAASLPGININQYLGQVIFGILIYLASISTLFYQLGIWRRVHAWWINQRPHAFSEQNKQLHHDIKMIKLRRKKLAQQTKKHFSKLTLKQQKAYPQDPDRLNALNYDLMECRDQILVYKKQLRYNRAEAYKQSYAYQISAFKAVMSRTYEELCGTHLNAYLKARSHYQEDLRHSYELYRADKQKLMQQKDLSAPNLKKQRTILKNGYYKNKQQALERFNNIFLNLVATNNQEMKEFYADKRVQIQKMKQSKHQQKGV